MDQGEIRYLTPHQAWFLQVQQCAALAPPAPEPRLMEKLSLLRVLTPGNFSATARQHRFRPIGSLPASWMLWEKNDSERGRRKATGR